MGFMETGFDQVYPKLTGSFRKNASAADSASAPAPVRPFDWFIKDRTNGCRLLSMKRPGLKKEGG